MNRLPAWRIAITLLMASVPTILPAQSPDDGYYGAVNASTDAVGAEFGYWLPALILDFSGAGGSADWGPALRGGLEASRRDSTGSFTVRAHAELGVGTSRAFVLVGPLYSTGGSGQSGGWGGRLSGGFHCNDHLSLGGFWNAIQHRSPELGAQLIVTF